MRAFLRWLLSAVAVAFGGLLAVFIILPGTIDPVTDVCLRTDIGRLSSGVLAGFLLISPLIALLRWVQAIRRQREISYATDNGRISVNLVAIEEALTRAIEGESEIRKARVSVYEDRVKRAIVIDAVVTLWEVANVTERNLFCQRLLRRRFAELMPERTDVQVNLAVHRLQVRPPSAKVAAPAVAPPPAAPVPDVLADPSPTPGTIMPQRLALKEPERLPRSAEPTDDELYVGPSYPVAKDEEEEATGVFVKPLPLAKR
jgi:hypothetical protein